MHDREISPDDIYKAMNSSDRDTYDREVTGLRQAGLLSEIRTNAHATQMAKANRQKKGSIARFKVVMPGSVVEFPVKPMLIPGKIAVFNLPVTATGEDIKKFFASYGTVLQVKVPSPRAGYSHKFAFVTFSEAKPAETLLAAKDKITFMGNILKIERPQEKMK